MAFTPVEWIALILIVVSAIKIVTLLVSPKSWMNLAKSVWKNTWFVMIVLIVLAAIVLYFLLQELTIVQILAVIAFTALLVGIGVASYAEDIIKSYERQIKGKILWKNGTWLYLLIWVVLLTWGAWVLFA